MKASVKAAVLAAKSSGEDPNKNVYYRGYDKNKKEVRVEEKDMPQSDDEKTKLAWKHGVDRWSKVTELDSKPKEKEGYEEYEGKINMEKKSAISEESRPMTPEEKKKYGKMK
jgi:hypothetical protein